MQIEQRLTKDLPVPSYTVIADHIDHAVKVGGIDHVGLGSDFDGIDSTPRGMEDVSKIPALVRELARRGYSEEDLEKILGGNVLRVMRQVEQVARAEAGREMRNPDEEKSSRLPLQCFYRASLWGAGRE